MRLRVVDVELVRIDVRAAGVERAADIQRIKVTLQQIAERLRSLTWSVTGCRFQSVGEQWRVGGQAFDFDRVGCESDVSKADGRTWLLVDLSQANLQLVLTTRQSLIEP